ALRRAEMWGVAAKVLSGYDFSAATLDEAWKGVLLNQFHDILPGSSIERVYKEAEALYAEVIAEADYVTVDATKALVAKATKAAKATEAGKPTKVKGGNSVTVFNDLSWSRSGLVPLSEGSAGAKDGAGQALPVQVVDGELMTEVTVPSCGWTTITAAEPAAKPTDVANTIQATDRSLENATLRVTFNDKGEIVSLVDKTVALGELATGPGNRFEMFKDVPTRFDAWDIDSMYEQTPVVLDDPAQIEVVAAGPLVGIVRVTRRLNNSTMTQEISLRRDSRRLDFRTTVDWHERHKLLKVAFPVNIHANEAVHEIQFGHIARPNHRSRPFDADQFEVANQKWTALMQQDRGCAVLNDCKYGVNVLGDTIKLTLLRSPLAPDMHADQGMQEFTYALYVWSGSFGECDVVFEGYDLNAPLRTAPGDAGTRSLFAVDAANVVIDTVKPAEDGSNDIVIRMYEAKRMTTACTLMTSLPVTAAVATDMLEREVMEDLVCQDGAVALAFRPFEVKTLRLGL
ncbi:MAG: alpha-mannosidase, partial [Anaerolineae bacterium]|nr:alpha-mannosidase [Anaerolineae bacterium]